MRERFNEWGDRAMWHVHRMIEDGSIVGAGKKSGTYWYRHADGIVLVSTSEPERYCVLTVLAPDAPLLWDPWGAYWYSSERADEKSLEALRVRFQRRV